MSTFQKITRAYCFSCLAAGVLRSLFPQGSSKTVIKGLTGLYILLSVLTVNIKALPDIVLWPETSDEVYDMGQYRQLCLAQTSARIEQACVASLHQAGIHAAEVTVQLTEQERTVSLESIDVILTDAAQADQAKEILSVYQARHLCVGGAAYG